MEYFVAVIIGYLLGSVNPAYICGRLKGFDIRERGSHNAGASNAKLTMGWPYFFIVVFYDVSKAIISYYVVNTVYPECKLRCVIAGCSAIIGHCFPFYLGFKGGKGFASFIGLSFVVDPKFSLILLVCGLIASLPLQYIVIATATQVIGFPIYMYVSGKFSAEMIIAVAMTSLVIVYKHRVNVVKILSKQEINNKGQLIGFNVLNKEKNEDVK